MKKILLLITLALIGLGIYPPSISSSNAPSPSSITINSGVRDLNIFGSAWKDTDGNVIGNIRLGNDFLSVYQKLNVISIVDRHGKRLYTLDLGRWSLGNSSLEGYFKSGLVEGYYFDWLTQEWVVWRRGAGMPDFSHPAFRQAFKWMLSIPIKSSYLNVTFYLTSHDPYIRILIIQGKRNDQLGGDQGRERWPHIQLHI